MFKYTKEFVEIYGKKVSPYSKYYIWKKSIIHLENEGLSGDIKDIESYVLSEPCYYAGKLTAKYKIVEDENIIYNVISRYINREREITEMPKSNKKDIITRADLMDLD